MVCMMSRVMLLSAVALLFPGSILSGSSGSPPSQGEPPPPALGGPKSFDFSMDHSTLVHVNITIHRGGRAWSYPPDMVCSRECKGRVHYRHPDCDFSCDARCSQIHRANLQPEASSQVPYSRDFGPGLQQFGFPGHEPWTQERVFIDMERQFDEAVAPILADPKNSLNKVFPHWNDTPCSRVSRGLGFQDYIVTANWQIYRFDLAPDGRMIRVNGPKGSADIGSLSIPTEAICYVREPRIECRCMVVIDPKLAPRTETGGGNAGDSNKGGGTSTGGGNTGGGTTGGSTGGGTTGGGQTGGSTGGGQTGGNTDPNPPPETPPPGCSNGDTGACIGPIDLDYCKFEVECRDMNVGRCTAENPTDKPITFCINPGTLCIPSDPTYQLMAFSTECRFNIMPRSRVEFDVEVVPASGPSLGTQNPRGGGEGRIQCLEMEKKQPKPGVKYKLGIPNDPKLVALMNLASKSLVRGPWDQVRTWIYTDKASHMDVTERLIPAPAEGTYLRLLHEVASTAGVDFQQPAYKKCLEPELLPGKGSAPKEAATWLVKQLDQKDPKALAKGVLAGLDAFKEILAPGADEHYTPRVAATAAELCRSSTSEVQAAGLKLLKEVVPPERRESFVKEGGLAGLWKPLFGSFEANCMAAMDVIEAFKGSLFSPMLHELESNGKSEAIKARAKAVLKSLGG